MLRKNVIDCIRTFLYPDSIMLRCKSCARHERTLSVTDMCRVTGWFLLGTPTSFPKPLLLYILSLNFRKYYAYMIPYSINFIIVQEGGMLSSL